MTNQFVGSLEFLKVLTHFNFAASLHFLITKGVPNILYSSCQAIGILPCYIRLFGQLLPSFADDYEALDFFQN